MSPPPHEMEGVIKFAPLHTHAKLSPSRHLETFAPLRAWRSILFALGHVGRDPLRYGGAGFGNVSLRLGPFPGRPGRRAFLISGTQTGGLEPAHLDHFCEVTSYDISACSVTSRGEVLPSSESLTHASIYDLSSHIRCVLHAHSPILWNHARALRIPSTHPDVAYGTQEMALDVRRLYRSSTLPERRILAMLGHEDGIVSFGRTPHDAAQILLDNLARALQIDSEGRLP